MKRVLYLIVLLLSSSYLTAQIKLSNTGTVFYNNFIGAGNSKLLNQEQLLAAPAEKIPVNFADTLKKYRWYDLCSYSFKDKQYTSPFTGVDTAKADPLSRQFDYFHISPSGIIFREFLLKTTSNEYSFYSVTYDSTTATRLRSITVINGATYMVQENYGETEHLKIVSYRNGVLILEITRFGKAGEKPVMFRRAYFSFPKN